MATDSTHSEGIRLQAERVVRAYKALRSNAHSANFTSDEFPVGQFVELVQQIKQLDVWLQPAEGSDEPERPDDTDDDTEITVLVGNHVYSIYGIHGLAKALMDLDEPKSLELAMALWELSKRLYSSLGSLRGSTENKIEAATGMKVWQ